METEHLIAEASRLEREVVTHKAAIRRHREQLGSAAAALAEVKRRCRAFGIGVSEVQRAPDPYQPGER